MLVLLVMIWWCASHGNVTLKHVLSEQNYEIHNHPTMPSNSYGSWDNSYGSWDNSAGELGVSKGWTRTVGRSLGRDMSRWSTSLSPVDQILSEQQQTFRGWMFLNDHLCPCPWMKGKPPVCLLQLKHNVVEANIAIKAIPEPGPLKNWKKKDTHFQKIR